jgi:hypothetical protein
LAPAYYALGLRWPDLLLDSYEGLSAELGRITPGTDGDDISDAGELAERLAEFVRVMRKAQRGFFSRLEDLMERHENNPVLVSHHSSRSCVAEVRKEWESVCAKAVNFHERFEEEYAQPAARLLRHVAAAPAYYLGGTSPDWIAGRPDRGSRPDYTAGRTPAAEALLRWRGDRYGPRVFVVAGSSGSGKTHLLSWFTRSTARDWSGSSRDPARAEATASLRAMDLEDCVRHLATQLGEETEDAGVFAATARPALITLAELHENPDPGLVVSELIRPLAANPHIRLVVEARDADALGLEVAPYVLDLDDPRCTDPDLFARWYAEELALLPGVPPFTADQVHPSPGVAVIAARARGADPGPACSIAERVSRAWLDGLSATARDAAATLALALAPMGLATWRLLHCGRHPHDPETASQGVDEAAACLPTAEPGIPGYLLRPQALIEAVAPLPGPGTHRELVAIMRGWPVSEHVFPANYVLDHLGGHLRLAGVATSEEVTAVPPCPPRVRVTRVMLEELFGPDAVVRFTPEQVHPHITHPATRRFLTHVGLPSEGLFQPEDPMRCREPITRQLGEESLRELHECSGMSGDLDSVFPLDFMDHWELLLDGKTGLVYEVPEAREHAYVAHRDVESYVYFRYAIRRDKALWRGRDEHPEAAQWSGDNLILELLTYEPLAMADPEQCWPLTLDDMAAGILST